MDTKERYGRFVLLNEDARTSAGSFFRAVQVGPGGYERHVQLFRSELLLPDVAQAVAEGLKTGLQIQHPQVARGLEAGRLDKTAFAAYEMAEGRSVGALLERSQSEGHPFAADHALLIVSKAAAALEAAQAKKRIHGFLVPEFVQVSHDGEVSVRGFGLSPRVLGEANCVGVREGIFLAPEVDTPAPLDIRADVFSLGAQLFEMLTGAPLPRTGPTSASIDAARIHSPGHDGAPIPKALAALLLQALAEDPARRFKDAAAFKKAVDTLLFSGDYSPTTFNLAFFMHTLFRDEGDQDAAQIKAEKNADYRAHVAGAVALAAAAPPPPAAPSLPRPAETPRAEAARPEPSRAESSRGGRASAPPTVAPVTASAADDQLFRTVMTEKKSLPVVPIVVVVLALAAVGGYLMSRSGSPPPAPAAAPVMSAAETAALAKVKELEARLAAIEAEKVAAEQKASDEATRKVEAQAKARGKAVDPLELQRAQEEARKQAQAEQAALVQAEKQKIEDERRRADEARQTEAARVAAEAAKQAESTPAPPPQSTPAPSVAAPPVAAPSVQTAAPAPSSAAPAPVAVPSAASGPALLDLADPNVVAPVLVSQSRIEYPPMARAQRIIGVVVISALVDETGNVAEARVIRGGPANSGLNEAALANVKKRKYKPGTLNGKPGRAWVAIQIDFKL